jgi:hypothetical protein
VCTRRCPQISRSIRDLDLQICTQGRTLEAARTNANGWCLRTTKVVNSKISDHKHFPEMSFFTTHTHFIVPYLPCAVKVQLRVRSGVLRSCKYEDCLSYTAFCEVGGLGYRAVSCVLCTWHRRIDWKKEGSLDNRGPNSSGRAFRPLKNNRAFVQASTGGAEAPAKDLHERRTTVHRRLGLRCVWQFGGPTSFQVFAPLCFFLICDL